MKDLTASSPFPSAVTKYYNCLLLHEKRPVLTGKKKYDKRTREWVPEIKYKCDECEKEYQ